MTQFPLSDSIGPKSSQVKCILCVLMLISFHHIALSAMSVLKDAL